MEEQNLPKTEEKQLTKRERKQQRREEQALAQLARAKSENNKRVVLWFSVLFLLALTTIGISYLANRDKGPSSATPLTDKISASDRIKGSNAKTNILVEYSDFQCPACRSYYPLIKRLVEEEEEKFTFVYRHFPLKSIHAQAELAARAAEAAGSQGKFWEMHNMLFENQQLWAGSSSARDTFIKYAEELSLDVEKFKTDMDSSEVKAKVNSDYASGIRANVQGTPTFFLNGKTINNPASYAELKSAVLSGS